MCKPSKLLVTCLATTFFGLGLLAPAAFAGIPEPGIILYGQVRDDSNALITSGTLTWTYAPVGGDESVTVSTELSEIEAPGGPFSYKVMIPLETEVPGHPISANTLPLSDTPAEYTRTASLDGAGISMTDTVTISRENRGIVEQITVGGFPPGDTDGDSLLDAWEQDIVDADPNDEITNIGDVQAGDDFDGDGENNGEEFANGTDPIDAMSARRGDVGGDKYIDLGDAIRALQVVGDADAANASVMLEADVNSDQKIGVEEAFYIMQKVSGNR